MAGRVDAQKWERLSGAAPALQGGRVLLVSKLGTRNVRFGSKADIRESARDVRFTPKSGHTAGYIKCPLSARSGH